MKRFSLFLEPVCVRACLSSLQFYILDKMLNKSQTETELWSIKNEIPCLFASAFIFLRAESFPSFYVPYQDLFVITSFFIFWLEMS